MIRTTDLGKAYGARALFEGVSLELNEGSRYGLVGANGSGKTTFIRIVSGDEQASSGTVNIPKRARVGVLREELLGAAVHKRRGRSVRRGGGWGRGKGPSDLHTEEGQSGIIRSRSTSRSVVPCIYVCIAVYVGTTTTDFRDSCSPPSFVLIPIPIPFPIFFTHRIFNSISISLYLIL